MVSVEGTDPQKGETDHVGSVGKAEPWRGLSQFKMRGSLDMSQEQDLGRRDILREINRMCELAGYWT